MLTIRPATAADIARHSKDATRCSLRAWVAEADGVPLGIAGLCRLRSGRWFAFCDVTSAEAAPYKMHIARAARRFFNEAAASGIRFIYTAVDPDEPRAVRWVTSLGFQPDPMNPDIYRWSAR